MFIEIDNTLINLNNVTNIVRFDEEYIRICFFEERDYIDVKIKSEEELKYLWESLRGVCLRKEGEQE